MGNVGLLCVTQEAKALKKKQAEAAAAAPVHSQQQQQQPTQAQSQQQSQPKRSSDQPRRQSATQKNSANKSKLAAGSPSIKLKRAHLLWGWKQGWKSLYAISRGRLHANAHAHCVTAR